MSLDIYKRNARSLAWYDQEGEPSTSNPFKKFKTHPRRTNSIQLESRLGPSGTAGETREFEERQPRAATAPDLAHSKQAGTVPPNSSGTDQFSRPETGEGGLETDPATRSCEPINASHSNGEDANDGKPRKRRTLLGKLGSHDSDADNSSQSPKSASGKQKFTVGGQLKATLFNSWVNVLIFAAPVGSKSHCPLRKWQH